MRRRTTGWDEQVEPPARLRAFQPSEACTSDALVVSAHAAWCRLRATHATELGWPTSDAERAREEQAALLAALGHAAPRGPVDRRAQCLARAARDLDADDPGKGTA